MREPNTTLHESRINIHTALVVTPTQCLRRQKSLPAQPAAPFRGVKRERRDPTSGYVNHDGFSSGVATKEENLETSLSLNRTIPRWNERARVLLRKKDVPWTNNGGKRIVGKWNIREEKVMKQMERRWIIGWQFYYFSNAAINHRVTMSVARACLLRFIGFPRRCQAPCRGRERMSFELVSKPFLCDVRERENARAKQSRAEPMKIQIPAFSSRSGGQMPDLRLHTDPRARLWRQPWQQSRTNTNEETRHDLFSERRFIAPSSLSSSIIVSIGRCFFRCYNEALLARFIARFIARFSIDTRRVE